MGAPWGRPDGFTWRCDMVILRHRVREARVAYSQYVDCVEFANRQVDARIAASVRRQAGGLLQRYLAVEQELRVFYGVEIRHGLVVRAGVNRVA